MRWAGHVELWWRGAYKVLVGNVREKENLVDPDFRWKNNIEMYLK